MMRPRFTPKEINRFYTAVGNGDELTVIDLLRSNSNLARQEDKKDKEEMSNEQFNFALQLAVKNGHLNLLIILLKQPRFTIDYASLFNTAASRGKSEIAIYLLSLNGIVNCIDDKTLHLGFLTACQQGEIKIVEALLQDPYKEKINLEKKGSDYLIKACEAAQVEVVKRLLQHHEVDPTLLNYAAFKVTLHSEIEQALLNHEKIDPAWHHGFPFIFACERGHEEIVKRFITENKVDPSVDSNAALMAACRSGHDAIVDILLSDARVNPDIAFLVEICRYDGHCEITHSILKKLSEKIKLTIDDCTGNIKLACEANQAVVLEFLFSQPGMTEVILQADKTNCLLTNLMISLTNQDVINDDQEERRAKTLLVILDKIKLFENAHDISREELLNFKQEMVDALEHIILLQSEQTAKLNVIRNLMPIVKWLCSLINFNSYHQERPQEAQYFFEDYFTYKKINTEIIHYFLEQYGSIITEKTLCVAFGTACLHANLVNIAIFKAWLPEVLNKEAQIQLFNFMMNNLRHFMPNKTKPESSEYAEFGGSNDCLIELIDLINKSPKTINMFSTAYQRPIFDYLLLTACHRNAIKIANHLVSTCKADPNTDDYASFLFLFLNLNKFYQHHQYRPDKTYYQNYIDSFNTLLTTCLKDERINQDALLTCTFKLSRQLIAETVPGMNIPQWIETCYKPECIPQIIKTYREIKREEELNYLRGQVKLFEKCKLLLLFCPQQPNNQANEVINQATQEQTQTASVSPEVSKK